ncbi:uncharacterized protein LOC144119599 [Amblyomma americanum]
MPGRFEGNKMKHATVGVLLLAVAEASFQPCVVPSVTLTALDNSTCIPEHYRGEIDGFILYEPSDAMCTSTVDAVTTCKCPNGDGVSGSRYCVHHVNRTADDNIVNVTLGLCGVGGRCHLYDFRSYFAVDVRDLQLAHHLKAFPRPCITANMTVTSELTAVAGCEYFCYRRTDRDIDDGRACVLEWYPTLLTKEPVVTLTGFCWNGICRHSENFSMPTVDTCPDRERYMNLGKTNKECSYRCLNGRQRRRPDGLACVLKKNWFGGDTMGVCKKGVCLPVREVECAQMSQKTRSNSPTSGLVSRYWLPTTAYTVAVAKSCQCRAKSVTTTLANDTLCVLSRSLGLRGWKLQTVGLCIGGECRRRPAPDRPAPYEFRKKECKTSDVKVTTELIVAASCKAVCRYYETEHRPNGTLCLLEWYPGAISGEPIVTLTGACTNGICRISGVYEYPVKGTCHDSERYKHHGKLMDKCTYRCPNGTYALRPDGLRCRFGKTWYKRDIVGVCQQGICSEIREENACALKPHHYRKMPPVKVAKTCACNRQAVENGVLCALSYKFGFGGYLLKEVGICLGGECKRRPPDRPPEHTFKKKECQVMDVQVTPELIVAAACSATCRRYEVEARPNGTLCLLQYRRDTYRIVQKTQTLHIGECWDGKCKYSDNSFDIRI